MTNEVMIKQLRKLRDKHANDRVMTFDTNWSSLCGDVANRIEDLDREITELKEKQTNRGSVCPICGNSITLKLMKESD